VVIDESRRAGDLIAATSRPRPSGYLQCHSIESGFTLVELLVVLLIIGLGFSLASINIGGSNSFEVQSEAKFFANRVALIAEEAVLSRQQWGVDIFREEGDSGEQFGYRWLVTDNNKQWLLANRGKEPGEFLFPPGIGLRLELEGSGEEMEVLFKQPIAEQRDPFSSGAKRIEPATTQDYQAKLVRPMIWLLSNGEMSAFTMTLFDREDSDNGVSVVGDELGRIRVNKGQADDDDTFYD